MAVVAISRYSPVGSPVYLVTVWFNRSFLYFFSFLKFPCKNRSWWIYTASTSTFSIIFWVQFHFCCIWKLYKCGFWNLIWPANFPYFLLKTAESVSVPGETWHFQGQYYSEVFVLSYVFKMRTRFTSWMVSYIMKHFWQRLPLVLFSPVFWFVFPIATDKSKGEGRIVGIVKWILFFFLMSSFISVVFIENKCGNWPLEFRE